VVDVDFFTSPIGLGHATRDVAIAQNFENLDVKFISGASAVSIFKTNGFDVEDVYYPPHFDVQNGLLKNPLRWLWKYYKYYKTCKEISSKIIEKKQCPKSSSVMKILHQ